MSPDWKDINDIRRDDLVTFAIGCSFSFEEAFLAANAPVLHIEDVPMYRTSIKAARTGVFSAPLVVSMRPMKPDDAIKAIQITGRFPSVHGAPVHIGDPTEIGIEDIAKPDYGCSMRIEPGEVPVFWACDVTPQAVIERTLTNA